MRGNWNLKEHELVFWKSFIETKIDYLFEHIDSVDDIDLSEVDLAPCQLYDILECLGYEKDDWDSYGWEQETWATFSNAENNVIIHVFSCGMTFELKLGLSWRE